jgi:integrase
MGVYARPDSPFWWMWIEGTTIRKSTGIPRGDGPAQDKEQKRLARDVWIAEQSTQAKRVAGLIVERPIIGFTKFAEWFEAHETAHHRGADKEASMIRQLVIAFDRYESLVEVDVDRVKEWMTARRRQVQPSTVNRELDVLKRLLLAAVPKYLAASPIAGLRRFRVDEAEPRILTPAEDDALLAIAGPADRAFLLTAIDTLLRLSNVVHLKWPQVKLERRVIVPLNAKVTLDAAPITRRLDLALRALPRSADWVFPGFHARGLGKTAAKNKAIRRFHLLCQQANLPHGRAAGGVTFHCLRHTGATRALQNGASVRTVMKLGGWKDERSVMRYVHAADSDVRAAAESISQPTPASREAPDATKSA